MSASKDILQHVADVKNSLTPLFFLSEILTGDEFENLSLEDILSFAKQAEESKKRLNNKLALLVSYADNLERREDSLETKISDYIKHIKNTKQELELSSCDDYGQGQVKQINSALNHLRPLIEKIHG